MKLDSHPHLREIAGLNCQAQTDYDGMELRGTMLVQYSMPESKDKGSETVILVPGAFDPYVGSYSDTCIRSLLEASDNGIGRVYEMHYFSSGMAGYINPEKISDDLRRIGKSATNKPTVVATSAGAMYLLEAIYCMNINSEINQYSKVIIIGPYLPPYQNRLGVLIEKLNKSRVAQIRIRAICGHSFLKGGSIRTGDWWKNDSEIQRALNSGRITPIDTSRKTPIYQTFFESDVISEKGLLILKEVFKAKTIEHPKIPGKHRSLMDIKEVDELILSNCCSAHPSNALLDNTELVKAIA